MEFYTENQQNTWPEYFDKTKTIELVNGEKLIRRYGKCNPGICFIMSNKNIDICWCKYDTNFLNIEFDTTDIEWMPGDFWISKKGTSCFRPGLYGKHVLIKSTGNEYNKVKKDAVYSRHASADNCAGVNYYIFNKDFHKEASIDIDNN